jgi:hypothetical protein
MCGEVGCCLDFTIVHCGATQWLLRSRYIQLGQQLLQDLSVLSCPTFSDVMDASTPFFHSESS